MDILVKRYLDRPITHSIDPANSPVSALTHHLFEVGNAEEKKAIVERLASGSGRRLLFMRTKHQARQMARKLRVYAGAEHEHEAQKPEVLELVK